MTHRQTDLAQLVRKYQGQLGLGLIRTLLSQIGARHTSSELPAHCDQLLELYVWLRKIQAPWCEINAVTTWKKIAQDEAFVAKLAQLNSPDAVVTVMDQRYVVWAGRSDIYDSNYDIFIQNLPRVRELQTLHLGLLFDKAPEDKSSG